MYHISNDVMPVVAHGRDVAPVTGSGKLARRYAQPNHGLIVTNGTGTLALAQRSRAAINRAYFELEDRARLYSRSPIETVMQYDNL